MIKTNGAAYRRARIFFRAATFALAILAVLLLFGMLVTSVLSVYRAETGFGLCGILSVSFAGGAMALAGVSVLCALAGRRYAALEKDCEERADGEHSFFVGEGTLATFEKDFLRIHSDKRSVNAPYSALRFYSVCTRKSPRDRGEWSVVIGLPARLVSDKGKGDVYIQTDGKERLYARLAELGLPLLGEQPNGERAAKPVRMARYAFPDKKRRLRAILSLAAGVVAAGAGIPLALFVQLLAGSLVCALGLVLMGRGVAAAFGASGKLELFREGVWYRPCERGEESVFLKWEEADGFSRAEKDGRAFLVIKCPYGEYYFPYAEGAEAYIRENFPEKYSG